MPASARKHPRRGAREARRALRGAPIPKDERAVKPGQIGGRYQPMSQADLARVHAAVLDVLESIGLAQAIPSCIQAVTQAGGRFANGRLYFPRALVEDTLAICARDITLHAQDPQFDLHLSGAHVHFGTAGAAVHVADLQTGTYRDSTLQDLYDMARLVDSLEHIHFFQRCLTARDVISPLDLDVNTCYASVMGTRKHVGSSWSEPEHLQMSLQMLHEIAGGEKAWRARPFVSMSNCFVVPPLRFAEDSCRCMEVAVHGGMPVLLLAAGQAGATSPAALAGALVQEVAEVLAALVWVNVMVPGHPAIFGTWPFVSDLRTGAMSGGSGEQAVLSAACGQMGRYYDLPTGVAAGMADAKFPDAQSGFEKGYTTTLAAHSGANLVYESAGMQASLLGCSFEGMLIDNDMLGAVNRTVRGIDINEDSLSIESIRDVCLGGPNHFLGHPQTLSLMQSEYLYPGIGDRTSPKEWQEQGRPDLLTRAHDKVTEILANHYPGHIDPATDDKLRARFEILLPREQVRAG